MKTVGIESPYAARAPFTVSDHTAYARLAIADSLKRGEAPFASHLLYTQVIDDLTPKERRCGMEAGLAISLCLDAVAVYIDLGISDGMAVAMVRYREDEMPMELRRLFSPKVGEALRAGRMTLKKAMELI